MIPFMRIRTKPKHDSGLIRMQELDKLDTEFNSIRDYLLEAAEFLRKFSSRNNGGNEAFGDNETKILSMLWVEADKYDELVLSMFESFRQVLGKKSSRSDTSRGVTENDYEEQSIFYFYCNWELIKDNDKLITVTLSSDNFKFQPVLRVQNLSLKTDQSYSVRSEGIYEKVRQLITESAIMEFDLEILSKSDGDSYQ